MCDIDNCPFATYRKTRAPYTLKYTADAKLKVNSQIYKSDTSRADIKGQSKVYCHIYPLCILNLIKAVIISSLVKEPVLVTCR